MKKIMLMMFILVLLVGTINAFEFDNVQDYDEDKREYLIENAFGLGDDIARIKLTSDLNQIVPRGYQKVAEFEVENYDDYVNVFNDMEFFDLRKDSEGFTRDFDYKYKTIIQVPTYKTICDKGLNENGTMSNINCREEQIGLKDKIVWNDINKVDGLLKGNITIGIFTNVEKGDVVEWIPTLFGERLEEWATWTENLNVDILVYYKLDESSGAVIDSTGNNNATNSGATPNVTGIINTAYDFEDTESDSITIPDMDEYVTNNSLTISVWLKPESFVTDVGIITQQVDTPNRAFTLRKATPGMEFSVFNSGGTSFTASAGITFALGSFNHLVGVLNGTHVAIYINGTLEDLTAFSGTIRNSPNDITIGRAVQGNLKYDGVIDEVGIWARALSSSEISDLYNNGSAISFTADFPPIITLNSPIDAFNTTNSTINFNGTVTSPLGITNVTLFIDSVLNETNSSGINDTDYLFTKIIDEGNHNWTYESCNSAGCTIAITRIFSIDSINPLINITFPFGTINFKDGTTNETLNWTATDLNLDTCFFDYDSSNTTVTCADNTTTFTLTLQRNLTFWANDTAGNLVFNFTSWEYLALENSQTFNASSFETAQESFAINITTNGTAPTNTNLIYDGTLFSSATITNPEADNYTLTRTINIPLTNGTKPWFFNFTIGNTAINSSTQNQIINFINFTICGASPQNVPFINITFKNETLAEENINATISSTWIYSLSTIEDINKTLTFTDPIEKLNYTFCGSPSDRTLNVQIDIDYDNSISQQRSFSSIRTISNITATEVLFLLPTSLGLFSPFKTTNINGDTITFVSATITRVLGGNTITVANGLTDSSGFATFFLDPNTAHTATFSKTGFTDNIFTFTPSTDLRTVVMGGGGIISNGTIITRGTTYVISPLDSTLPNNTVITFTFNVTSNLTTITLISMNITNSSNSELLFVSNAGIGNLSGTLDTGNNTKLFGSYIIQTAEETISVTRIWLIFTTFAGDYSIFTQFTLAKDNELITEFMRLLIVLSFMVAVLIFMNAGKIIETSESNIAVLLLMIWAFSIVGWLDTGLAVSTTNIGINRLGEFSNQFGIAIVMTGASILFIFRRLFIRKSV